MGKRLSEVTLFLDAAKQLVELGEQWEKKARTDMGKPSCDRCKLPGCCYQMVLATPIEAMAIAVHLDSLAMNTPDYRAELMVRGKECEDEDTRAGWLEKAEPCVFLGQDMKCRVYPWRPINCRAYLTWSDPVHCVPQKLREDGQPTSIAVEVGDNRPVIATSLMMSQGIVAASGASIERPYIRSLPSMVSVMLDALLAITPTEFWLTVTTHAPMAMEVFERMMRENERDARHGQEP